MPGLGDTITNAANFKPTVIDQDYMGFKRILKEMLHTEYVCPEHPHVMLRFLLGNIVQVFGSQKQPILHTYQINHLPDQSWEIVVLPTLTDGTKSMTLNIMKNHLTLTSKETGEVIHLNKLNLKAYDNAK